MFSHEWGFLLDAPEAGFARAGVTPLLDKAGSTTAGGLKKRRPELFRPPQDYLYFINAALFAITIFLSIALVKFGPPGLPLRALTATLILITTFVASPWIFGQAVRAALPILVVILVCALIALLSSTLNASPPEVILRQLLEIHVQAAIGTVVGACLLRTCGAGVVVKILAMGVALTVFVAFFQFLGVSPAWALREFLDRIQPADLNPDSIFLTMRMRAMGLSYSPVHVGTQICLAFAGWAAYVLAKLGAAAKEQLSWLILAGAVCVLFASLISGNRSPILGIVVFCIGYLFLVRPAIAILLALAMVPSLFILDDIMQDLAEAGLRVARTDDGSSSNRRVLRAFGFMLFFDRPYGYGLSFNSVEHWSHYWEKLKHYPNPMAIQLHALHNYYMMILNKYGGLILFVFAYVVVLLVKNPIALLCLTPYIIHIFFHNDGPLQADFLIWSRLPSLIYLTGLSERGLSQGLPRG